MDETSVKLKKFEPAKVVVKLDVNEGQKFASNVRKWSESYQSFLNLIDHVHLLDEDWSIVVPSADAQRHKMQKQIVKFRDDRLSSMAEQPSTKKEKDAVEAAVRHMEENAERLASRMAAVASSSVGAVEIAVFANPVTSLPRPVHAFPEVSIEIKPSHWPRPGYFEVESTQMREWRSMAWHVLVDSLSALDEHMWRHIPVGDVHQLFFFVKNNFEDTSREREIKRIEAELLDLERSDSETFQVFHARVKSIWSRMHAVSFTIDSDLMSSRVRDALRKSAERDSDLRDCWRSVKALDVQSVARTGTKMKTSEMLDMLAAMMLEVERDQRSQNVAGQGNGSATVMYAKSGTIARGVANDRHGGRPSTDESVVPRGVCVFFNKDGCQKGDSCTFKHERVSPTHLAAIERKMKAAKERRSRSVKDTRVCYECGETGHIKLNCPKLRNSDKGASVRVQKAEFVEMPAEFAEKVSKMSYDEMKAMIALCETSESVHVEGSDK